MLHKDQLRQLEELLVLDPAKAGLVVDCMMTASRLCHHGHFGAHDYGLPRSSVPVMD
jgi:hypothetical protein